MSPFLGPSGGVQPGIRNPVNRPGTSPNLPWATFSPNDINRCYPIPAWVADRIRDFPQAPVGNALRDPLPVPFTKEEVHKALMDVWRASHQKNNRWCANVSPASVQIAMQVMPILNTRNGGWIDFSGRRYDPMVNTPGSSRGQGANLQCVLYKLPGKPIPPAYNRCNATPAPPWRTYSILDVATTFESSQIDPPGPPSGFPSGFPFPGSGLPAPARPDRPLIGADIEEEVAVEPPGLPLFALVASFEAHE